MRPLTILRALAWIGVAVAFWSLSVRWGADARLGAGPPTRWERHVVGASLLAAVAALALSLSGRRGAPPAPLARGIAIAASAGGLALAIALRASVSAAGFEHVVKGPGWTWLAGGTALAAAASATTLALRTPVRTGRRSRGKRR